MFKNEKYFKQCVYSTACHFQFVTIKSSQLVTISSDHSKCTASSKTFKCFYQWNLMQTLMQNIRWNEQYVNLRKIYFSPNWKHFSFNTKLINECNYILFLLLTSFCLQPTFFCSPLFMPKKISLATHIEPLASRDNTIVYGHQLQNQLLLVWQRSLWICWKSLMSLTDMSNQLTSNCWALGFFGSQREVLILWLCLTHRWVVFWGMGNVCRTNVSRPIDFITNSCKS